MITGGLLVGLAAVAWAVALCLARVRRLHRLHIRLDAAHAGLDAALGRRAAAAAAAGVTVAHSAAGVEAAARGSGRRSVTTPVPDSAAGVEAAVRGSGRRSVTTPVPDSAADAEAAANALGRALAGLDRAALPADVRAELVEAEQLLVLARRVHNDAVRDTLGLRSRRLVRWLRLAGTAPMPAYFEIADPPPALTYDRVSPTQE